MTTKKQTVQDGCNRDLTLAPETEQSAKEAAISLSQCVAVIHAQQQADIVYDLIAGGQQEPDLLNRIIGEQHQARPFVAQIQKRIAGGAR